MTLDEHEDLDELAESQMSFGDHLEELRSRIFKALGALLVAFVVVFSYRNMVLQAVTQPYTDVANALRINPVLNNFIPAGTFIAYLKVSAIVAALFAAPLWIYQFWAFIGAGLYSHERKIAYRYSLPMFVLFAGGVYFGYSLLIPFGLRYLLSFNDPTIVQNWIGLNEYLALFTTLTLVLGLVFQLPIAMAVFAKLQFVTPQLYRSKRRFFILGSFVLSALLTPPDVITQVLMAIPLSGLYELGIFLAWWSMGEEREPIAWSKWRGRLIAAAIFAAAMVYFQGEITTAYKERLVAQKLRSAPEADDVAVPYVLLFSMSELFTFEPRHAYLISDEGEGELWCVAGDGPGGAGAELVTLHFASDRIRRTGFNERSASFVLNSTSQSVDIRRVDEMPATEFGALLVALEDAAPEHAVVLERMITGLVGKRPDGIGAQPDVEGIDAAVETWRRWWDENFATFVYRSGD